MGAWSPQRHKRSKDGRFATLEELEAKKWVAYNKKVLPVGAMPRGQLVRDLSAEQQAERKRRRALHDRKTTQELEVKALVFGGAIVAMGFLPAGQRLFNARQLATPAAGAMRPGAFAGSAAAPLPRSAVAARAAAMASPTVARNLAHDFALMRSSDAKALSHSIGRNGVTQPTINSSRSNNPNENARLVTQLLAHADPKDTPQLVRGMHGLRPNKVGDVMDFGQMSSFTDDFTVGHDWVKNSMARSGQVHGLFVLDKGTAPALRIDQSMRANPMGEWLVGGRYEISTVVDLPSAKGAQIKLYTLRPFAPKVAAAPAPVAKAFALSAFGVAG